VPVLEAVVIPFVLRHLSGDGDERVFTATEEVETSAKSLLDALVAWVPATRTRRAG
jgi:hypothetical protein